MSLLGQMLCIRGAVLTSLRRNNDIMSRAS